MTTHTHTPPHRKAAHDDDHQSGNDGEAAVGDPIAKRVSRLEVIRVVQEFPFAR